MSIIDQSPIPHDIKLLKEICSSCVKTQLDQEVYLCCYSNKAVL